MQPLPILVRRRRHHLPRWVISSPPGWCDGGNAFIAYLRTHRAACAAAMLSGPGRQGASTRSPRVARCPNDACVRVGLDDHSPARRAYFAGAFALSLFDIVTIYASRPTIKTVQIQKKDRKQVRKPSLWICRGGKRPWPKEGRREGRDRTQLTTISTGRVDPRSSLIDTVLGQLLQIPEDQRVIFD